MRRALTRGSASAPRERDETQQSSTGQLAINDPNQRRLLAATGRSPGGRPGDLDTRLSDDLRCYGLIVPTAPFQAASEIAARRHRASTSYFPRSDRPASPAHFSRSGTGARAHMPVTFPHPGTKPAGADAPQISSRTSRLKSPANPWVESPPMPDRISLSRRQQMSILSPLPFLPSFHRDELRL